MKLLLRSLIVLAGVLFASALFAQGTTTSSVSGQIVDENNEGLIGAVVKATHVPSGTVYSTIAQESGTYVLPNTRVGGPYTISVSYVGYDDLTAENVFLQLGERFNQDFTFDTSGTTIESVVITSVGASAGQNNGVANQITTEQIEQLPTLDRNLNDFTRTTPQANTSVSGLSIAGLNNRYNAVYIDGAVNNDVFGLAADGTNGGQIGISPISVDAVEQIQVVVSPYDVTLGGFAGGGINAVTRSGTNNVEGSAYYYIQNEDFAGDTNGEFANRFRDGERTALQNFTERVYGFRLGAPIIKDKLFFFVNGEIQDNETPFEFQLDDYQGGSTPAEINDLVNFVNTNFGYDIGSFENFGETLEGTKFLGKIDFNLDNKNKFTARHSYNNGELNGRGSSSSFNSLRGGNSRQFFPSTTNSSALEWNHNGNAFSNNLILGYTSVRDDRGPLGDPFPFVRITDFGANGFADIRFGSEPFSSANLLEQDVFTITNNFNLYKGNHTFTFGTHNEFSQFLNIFVAQNFSEYRFDSLQDFYDGNVDRISRSYSIVDGGAVGDNSTNAAADFSTTQLGFYAQDEWFANDNLTVTYGIRADIPFFNDDPGIFQDFTTVTAPAIRNAGWSIINEVENPGQAPSAQVLLSPRAGFNWSPADVDGLTIKGGAGIFTSRIPFVWPGAMFNTNGTKQGGIFADVDFTNGIVNAPQFEPDVNNQPTAADIFGGTDAVPQGDVNLFVEDFKFPQVFRTSLGVEKTFGDGWNVSVDGIYTKTLNNVVYQSVNFENNFTSTPGPESRIQYVSNAPVDSRYRSIYVGYNTNEGHSFNFSTGVNKQFENFFGSLFYSYGDSYALNEGTSSQNSSQWRGQVHDVGGRNNPVFGRSDFSAGHRIVGTTAYKFDWNSEKNVSTTVSLFYNGQSGTPFSWIIGGDDADNFSNENGSTSRNRTLFYIPQTRDDINLMDTDDLTADEQWALLNQFIEDDDYLSEHRGEFAEKNSSRLPFESQLDVKVLQDFGLTLGDKRHRFQFSADIFNFGNLLSKDWGTTWRTNDSFSYQNILNFQGFDTENTPVYTFTDTALGDDRFNINDVSSRWRAQIGFRYLFD